MSTKESRRYYVDLLKIMAIVFVIYNHTGNMGFLAYSHQNNLIIKIFQIILAIVCKSAVPIFFMCSGALILNRNISKVKLSKKILKYIICLLSFSLGYYLYLSFKNGTAVNIEWLLRYIYHNVNFSYSGCYWFIYAYIAFLVMAPILKIISDNINENDILYLIVIYILFCCCIPVIEKIFNLGSFAVEVPVLTTTIIYPIIGAYFDKNNFFDKKILFKISNLKLMVIGSFIFAFISVCIILKDLNNSVVSEKYLSLAVLMISMLLFCLMKKYFYNFVCKKKYVEWLIKNISNCVFGIFLVHGFVMNEISVFLNSNLNYINYFGSLTETIIVFFSSFVISLILNKIPLIKKIM